MKEKSYCIVFVCSECEFPCTLNTVVGARDINDVAIPSSCPFGEPGSNFNGVSIKEIDD